MAVCVAFALQQKEFVMLSWVTTLVLIALIVGLLGFVLMGGVLANLLKLGFLMLLALLVIGVVTRLMPPQAHRR